MSVGPHTFPWLGQSGRLSKDYERLRTVSEAMIYAKSRPSIRRLIADVCVTVFRESFEPGSAC